jgi:hypothetical protein
MGNLLNSAVYDNIILDAKIKAIQLAPNQAYTAQIAITPELQEKLTKLNSDSNSEAHIDIASKILSGSIVLLDLCCEDVNSTHKLAIIDTEQKTFLHAAITSENLENPQPIDSSQGVPRGAQVSLQLNLSNTSNFAPNLYFIHILAGSFGAKLTLGASIISVDNFLSRNHRSRTLLNLEKDPALLLAERKLQEQQLYSEINSVL